MHDSTETWTEDELLRLVDLYRQETNLWNPNNVNYFKRENKLNSWEHIAQTLGKETTPDICKKKIIGLLSSYRRERGKARNALNEGKGRGQVYKSRWFAYEAFRFLEGREKPRDHLVDTDQDGPEELDEPNSEAETPLREESGSCKSPPSKVPKFLKKRKRFENGSANLVAEALSLMKSAAEKLKAPSTASTEMDQDTAFGNLVVSKMRSYSRQTRTRVEHAILEILMKADNGSFDQEALSSANSKTLQDYISTTLPSSLNLQPTLRNLSAFPYNVPPFPQSLLGSIATPPVDLSRLLSSRNSSAPSSPDKFEDNDGSSLS